ncbi:cysteine hydrolase family protein [Salinicola avicenniae]|uniref:cysteine hydrolase family protein n=1 Tax=Salinicola avicenniae TaxID=2916836 RepID=UPI002073C572|nr:MULTISPECIES: isochorismatase family cysteine hydrolase [unclassified Salinicola]
MSTTATPNTALLIMDLQNGILASYEEKQRHTVVERANRLIADARHRGLPVIFVAVRFRPGYPEVSDDNKLFRNIRDAGVLIEGSDSAAFHPDLDWRDDDIVVIKRRVGAASTTDLATCLKANDIQHLAMAGVATSGVVLSTVRWAADLDYRLTVIGDACLDQDAEVHRVLTEKVLPVQATVTDCEAWLGQS